MSKDLKVTRVFSTLVEEMKKIGCASSKGESKCSHATPQLSQRKRSPVLLLMGGGMGAGKSTVLKDILKECVLPILNLTRLAKRLRTFRTKFVDKQLLIMQAFLVGSKNKQSDG